jgi:hypothetical protein
MFIINEKQNVCTIVLVFIGGMKNQPPLGKQPFSEKITAVFKLLFVYKQKYPLPQWIVDIPPQFSVSYINVWSLFRILLIGVSRP